MKSRLRRGQARAQAAGERFEFRPGLMRARHVVRAQGKGLDGKEAHSRVGGLFRPGPGVPGAKKIQPRAKAKLANGKTRPVKARGQVVAGEKYMPRFRRAVAGEINIVKPGGAGRKRRGRVPVCGRAPFDRRFVYLPVAIHGAATLAEAPGNVLLKTSPERRRIFQTLSGSQKEAQPASGFHAQLQRLFPSIHARVPCGSQTVLRNRLAGWPPDQ